MLTNAIRRFSIWLTPQLAQQKLQSINFGINSQVIRVGLVAFLVLGLGSYTANAQHEVSGTVTDSTDGNPLPGVNIIVKGTTTGTSTNANGEYNLKVQSDQDTLVASFVGYIAQNIPINGRSTIDIQLYSDVQQLQDVVVVGYGTQKKQDATGSITAVTENDFNKGVITSPEQLLEGRAAGIQITPASGEPGAGQNIRIRGTSSVRSNNDPLFVVDGVPLSGGNITPASDDDFGIGAQPAKNPLSFLNPDDIESISVLKDASAAAIYGSRGSNGVVLITTKKGTAGGGGQLNVASNTSFSAIREKLDLLTAGEYADAAVAKGADAATFQTDAFSGSTDWQDEIYRTAITQDYSLGYGGGNEQTQYRVSLGYMDQEGIVENSGLERLTGRINATHKMLDDKLQLNLNLINTRLEYANAPVSRNAGFEGDLIGAALQANPLRPTTLDGTLNQSSDFRNPVAMLRYIDDNSETTRILASLSGTYDFTEWLSYKLNFAYDNSEAVRRTGIDPRLQFNATQDKGRAIIDNLYTQSTLIEHTLNAQRDFSEKINMNFLAGFSYQRFENRGDFLQSEFFVTDEIPFVDNVDGVDNSGENKAFSARSNRSVEELQSFFGRAGFNYDEKYLATVNFRVDGSTKFGKNNKYGYFPSVSAAWRISEEDFFSGLRSTVSDLKLRAGYGITGNQEFPGGVSLAIFNVNDDGSITQANNPNPDIQWEETKQYSIGLDFELFDGQINGSVDYFNKQTDNLIFRKDFAQPAAVDFQWVNLDGTVENKGIEFSLDAFAVNNSQFSWKIAYNMSFLDNEVTKLGTFVNTGEISGQGLSGAYSQRIAEGQPLFSFYMREFAGYDENGLATYANDGELSFQGDPLPDYNLGLTNSFNYGRFDASVFISGSFGFQVYNNTANAIFLAGNLRNGRNVTADVAGSPESGANFGEVSTRFLEDGDFIRLSNLSIGYNVNVSSLAPVQRLRFSVTGQNLFVITDYSGYDPEVNTDKNINGVPSLGIDYTAYPRARTVTFGINLDF